MVEKNYSIKRFYEGRQTVTEALTEIIADRVRKKLKKDVEFLKEKEYNLDCIQDDTLSLSGLCG